MPNKRTTRPAGTLSLLVETLGVSKRRVSQLLTLGMPEDPVAALEWKTAREDGDDSSNALRKERILLVRAQREKIEHELRVKNEQTISRAEVVESITRVYSVVRNRLLQFSNELPPRLDGLGPAAMAQVLRDEVIAVLTDLSSNHPYENPE